MEILNNLNETQKNALLQTRGAILVSAGAGSGKTKLLTHRIAYLISELGVKQHSILAITFTNKAANEMKQRIATLIGENNNVWISTFHSMCVRILRENAEFLGETYNKNFVIYTDTDSEKVIKLILAKYPNFDQEVKKYSFHIGNMKNKNLTVERYQSILFDNNAEQIIKVIAEYDAKLAECNALDFDDLLVKTYNLFASNADILNKYAQRFEYVLVDEFQDTNVAQYELVKQLSSVHKNIFVVGDEDQSIYSWRGANFKNIFNFKNDFENVSVFKLEQNYRSTKSILNLANSLIKNNSERFDKNLWTDNDEGKKVEYYEMHDEQQEAESVCSKIMALANNGYNYSDMAILLRLNALTLPFEEKLLAYNIPHRIYGGFKFYERQEIKNVIAYLKVFVNNQDEISLRRIINFPKRGIGDGAMSKLSGFATANGEHLLSALLTLNQNPNQDSSLHAKFKGFTETFASLQQQYISLPASDFIEKVIEDFNIKSAYNTQEDDGLEKTLNIDAFVNSVKNYFYNNPESNLAQFLESITLEADIDTMDESNNVTISTVHAVKGLEFKVVFVVGLEQGIFPISRAINSPQELEEERRLMYVAITRAKERLLLSSCKTRYLYGRRSYMSASCYIAETDLKNPYKSSKLRDYNNSSDSSGAYYSKFNITKPSITVNTSSTVKNSDTSKFKALQKVSHPKFGNGVILQIVDDGACADIMFENFGKKTLILEIAPLEIIE